MMSWKILILNRCKLLLIPGLIFGLVGCSPAATSESSPAVTATVIAVEMPDTPTPPPSIPTSTSSPTPSPMPQPQWTVEVNPTPELAGEAQDSYLKGITYVAAGLFDEALVELNRTIELAPDYAPAYFERGKLFELLDRPEQARADYQQALELTGDAELRTEIAAQMEQLGPPRLIEPSATPAQSATVPATPQTIPTLPVATSIEAPLDQPFALGVTTEARLDQGVLSLQLLDILEDSRCPSQVTCAWAGQLRLLIGLKVNDQQVAGFELNTNPPLKMDTVIYGGYTIQLLGAEPYPELPEQSIPPEAYQVTFLVSKDG